MNTEINDGGPAFPKPVSLGPNGEICFSEGGMSLRNYFAAKAMQAIIAHEVAANSKYPGSIKEKSERLNIPIFHIAEFSYEIADAMLLAEGETGR